MASSQFLEENNKSYEEKRTIRIDRRIREERRAGRDPKYLGEARRMTVDRRLGLEDRRTVS